MASPLKSPHDVVTTAWGKRGSYWSCNEDSSGNGVHTGADFACPSNTNLYAAIAGTIRHRSYGSAFGDRCFAISPSEGQPFAKGEIFYAHGNERLADGTEVQVGDYVGKSGARGNVSGPHLHLEYHADSKNVWSCSAHDNPQPVLDHEEEEASVGGYWYSGKPSGSLTFDDSYKRLDVDKWAPDKDCIILGMLYANIDGAGEIRVRLVRDPDDATAYQTFYIQGGDNFLLTHVWFEKAEANRKLWWEFQSMDGTSHTIGTRYCKFAVLA